MVFEHFVSLDSQKTNWISELVDVCIEGSLWIETFIIDEFVKWRHDECIKIIYKFCFWIVSQILYTNVVTPVQTNRVKYFYFKPINDSLWIVSYLINQSLNLLHFSCVLTWLCPHQSLVSDRLNQLDYAIPLVFSCRTISMFFYAFVNNHIL